MRTPLALLLLAASAAAQAVTDIVVPETPSPEGCQNSRTTPFQITIQNVTAPPESTSAGVATPAASGTFAKRLPHPYPLPLPTLYPRQLDGILTITMAHGVLTDQANRTGYIASNYQFQFDRPPQSGAIYTGGFSLCSNGSLALGGSAVFYQCLSGTFYNLYDRKFAEHCVAVYILAIGGAGDGLYSTAPPEPVSTGPSEATIANGGGTVVTNSTTGTGIGEATGTSGGGGGSASETGAGGSATESGAVESASSGDAAVPTGLSRAQGVLGWAVGLAGLVVVV